MYPVFRRKFLLGFGIAFTAISAHLGVAQSASAAEQLVDVYEIKQQTDHLGPVDVFVSTEGIKFIAPKGGFTVYSKKPTWKVIGLNHSENQAFSIPLEEWPTNGLKMFKGDSSLVQGKRSIVRDTVLNLPLMQLEVASHGRFYGSNDPTIFRSAVKKELASNRWRVSPEVPLNPEQQKIIQGIYSMIYVGGYPVELCAITTDGALHFVYQTSSITKKKMPISTFNYPVGYKLTKDKLDIYMTNKQKKTFEDFLDVFTDDPALRTKKANK